MKKQESQDSPKLRGHYHAEIHEAITKFKNPIKSFVYWLYEILNYPQFLNKFVKNWCRGKLLGAYDYDNLIPTVGLTAFAAQMSGDNTTNIGDNLYIAVGSNVTAPLAGDTQLGTETTRKAAGSTSFSAGIASIAVFFAATEATGTHREFGLFGDGNAATASGAANSGILFSHVAANVAVAATETLTLTFELTFTN